MWFVKRGIKVLGLNVGTGVKYRYNILSLMLTLGIGSVMWRKGMGREHSNDSRSHKSYRSLVADDDQDPEEYAVVADADSITLKLCFEGPQVTDVDTSVMFMVVAVAN